MGDIEEAEKLCEELSKQGVDVKGLKKEIDEIHQALNQEKEKQIAKQKKEKDTELRKRADEALSRFKSGAKIEYDDMVLLQKFELL